MIKMKVIHPHKDESYRVGYDDHCLVVSSGEKREAPKVWISKSMAKWIAEHIEDIT
jgi:hypothetical protein